jgi:arylsulfatase A-like enzyme
MEECVRFLRQNREGPFFLYLAHMHVHLPLYAADRFMESSENGRYGACVECVDWSINVLMHELQRLGLEENTMIVFTSDNGSRQVEGGSNAPLRGRKGQTWEGGMRVPCIVRWPGVVPAGTTCSELTTAMDFLPTFAGLAGAEAPSDRIIDGHDIWPLLSGQSDAVSPYEAFYYYRMNDLQAVRSGPWKLHVSRRGETVQELYNLDKDVGETNNIAADNPDIVRELEAKLDECRRDLGDAATGTEGENCRPIGVVSDPEPLTEYDPDHPYIISMYDLPQVG